MNMQRVIDQNQKELCRKNSELLGGRSYCRENYKEIVEKLKAETG